MYIINYKYNHGTWIESRNSGWLKTEEIIFNLIN